MKPLTSLKFFKENKRKAIASFIVLIFTVCAISLITVLINSLIGTIKDLNLKPLEYLSVVSSMDGEFYLKDSVVNKLNDNPNVEELLPADFGNTSINLAIGGNSSVPVIFLKKSYYGILMDKMGDTIKEGRMPQESTNEIAVHWRIMANKKWKIGDTVGSFKDKNELLIGEYKIVGKIDGPNVIFIGTESFKQKQLKANSKVDKPTGYVIFPKKGKRDALNKFLSSINKTEANVFAYDETKKLIDTALKGINSTIVFIIFIVNFILSISVGALMYVIYIQRSDEFGILYAMGYRRSFIRNLIIKEIMSLNLICWTAGLIFTFGVIYLLNRFVYNPKGEILTIFSTNVLTYTLIIPIMVGLFSILPIAMRLRKWDPVAVIERRE